MELLLKELQHYLGPLLSLFNYSVLVAALTISASAQSDIRCPDGPTRLDVKLGTFYYRPGIPFLLSNFAASMTPRGKTMPSCLAKTTDVESGFVTITGDALTRLFDEKMQSAKGKQNIHDVKIQFKNGEVLISGIAEKGVPLHFSIQGPVDALGGRDIRLYARKVSVLGIPVKGLLQMIGLQVGNVMHLQKSEGVITQENSLFFDPEKLAHIVGHIGRAEVRNDRLEVTFSRIHKQAANR